MVDVLREDFARLPQLLALGPPAQPEPAPEMAAVAEEPEVEELSEPASGEDEQLGLF
jgi:hypothetical protein